MIGILLNVVHFQVQEFQEFQTSIVILLNERSICEK